MTEIFDTDDRDRDQNRRQQPNGEIPPTDDAVDAYAYDGGLMLQAGSAEAIWMHRNDIADLGEWQ